MGDGTVRTRSHPLLNATLREVGKVRTCALGGDHSVVIMVTNLVYSFGRGDKGQLGLPKIGKSVILYFALCRGQSLLSDVASHIYVH